MKTNRAPAPKRAAPVARASRPVARATSSTALSVMPLAAHQDATPAKNDTGAPVTPTSALAKGRIAETSEADKPGGVKEGLGSIVTDVLGGWPDG